MRITTLGIDLAKSVFQLHGVNEAGEVVLRRQLRRAALLAFLSELPACRIGMEACASAHDWGRRISAMGHDVRLIAPAYVKPYVKRQKNDAADAEAICEAVLRPGMGNVPIKSEEQQGCLMLHRSRDLLMRQRTMLLNAMRSHLGHAQPSCGVRDRAAKGTSPDHRLHEELAREWASRSARWCCAGHGADPLWRAVRLDALPASSKTIFI